MPVREIMRLRELPEFRKHLDAEYHKNRIIDRYDKDSNDLILRLGMISEGVRHLETGIFTPREKLKHLLVLEADLISGKTDFMQDYKDLADDGLALMRAKEINDMIMRIHNRIVKLKREIRNNVKK